MVSESRGSRSCAGSRPPPVHRGDRSAAKSKTVRSGSKVVGKQRIGFITRSTAFGGAEKHLSDLLARLPRESVEPILMCFGGNPYADRCRLPTRDHVDVMGALVWRSSLQLWFSLVRMHLNSVVFVNSFRGVFPGTAYIAARLSGAAKVYAIEHAVTAHAPPPIVGNGIICRVRRVVGRRARERFWRSLPGRLCSRTICVSDAVRERLVSEWGYPSRSTITIRNGVDLKHYSKGHTGSASVLREELGISGAEPIVLCVGRLSREKGVSFFFDALSLIEKRGLRVHGLIVGDGPLRATLEKQLDELGLGSRVTFTGHQEDVRPYYGSAAICVLPSLTEGLPLVLLEAMASGVPCIATEVGGTKEVISHGVDGLLVPPSSSRALASAIERLLTNRQECAEIAARGRRRVEESFDIEVSAQKIQTVLLGHDI